MLNVKMKFDEVSNIGEIPKGVYFSNSKLVFKLKGHKNNLMPVFIKREIVLNRDDRIMAPPMMIKRIICVGSFTLSSLNPITVSGFMPTFSGSMFSGNTDLNIWFSDLLFATLQQATNQISVSIMLF